MDNTNFKSSCVTRDFAVFIVGWTAHKIFTEFISKFITWENVGTFIRTIHEGENNDENKTKGKKALETVCKYIS